MNKYSIPIAVGSIVSSFYGGYGLATALGGKISTLRGEQAKVVTGLTAVSILVVAMNKTLEEK